MSIVCFVVFGFLIWLANKGGEMLMNKFLTWVAGINEKKTNKEQKKIKDLNAALHAMSQKNSVVVWDMIWSVPVIF